MRIDQLALELTFVCNECGQHITSTAQYETDPSDNEYDDARLVSGAGALLGAVQAHFGKKGSHDRTQHSSSCSEHRPDPTEVH